MPIQSDDLSGDYRDDLLQMMVASTLEETTALGIKVLHHFIDTAASVFLIWDTELERYIIGDMHTGDERTAPAFRRTVLRHALNAHQENYADSRCIHADGEKLFYQPLNTPDGVHVGAYVFPVPHPSTEQAARTGDFKHFVRASTRALWVMTRIEQADREHAELEADRARLKQLLHAVDQQQQTIDRLLTLERQFSASLETQVEERTRALQEAQTRIINSEKLAVIGQLAASLAHEINNPLQAIQSGLGLAISELESGHIEDAQGDLLVIQSELERIQAIFKQMLDFNRPPSGSMQPLDLNAICEGVQVLMRKRLQESRVTLRLDLAPDLPLTCGDSNQIKQVLINLILNAAEAMPPAGGGVRVRTTSERGHVLLSITDSGSGIAPAHLKHLFEPFFTTKTRGLGLGLAISREIIEGHHGTITAESVEGQGTTFTITLLTEDTCDERKS